jgi:hypothetical protein
MSDLEILKEKLRESQVWLERQTAHLRSSYAEFSGVRPASEDLLKNEEALTARFSRLSDIRVKRFYRVVAELADVPSSQVLDVLHHAEKIGLLDSVDRMRELRLLRNRIAHEYETEPSALVGRVLDFTPWLIEQAERAIAYRQP